MKEVHEMAKMGRPKSEFPKQRSLGIRVTEKEYEKLKAYASKHNLTITEILKKGLQLFMENNL